MVVIVVFDRSVSLIVAVVAFLFVGGQVEI